MAAMVASSSSQLPQTLPHQESGHRNKRKFRSDTPALDPSNLIQPQIQNSANYGFPLEFGAEELRTKTACDICTSRSLPCPAEDEIGFDDFPDADWNTPTEAHLKELLLSNLDTIFSGAISKVVSHGYTEDAARKAVLKSGLYYAGKDSSSNIVDNVLASLKSGQDAEDTSQEHSFEDLRQLEEHLLSEMVSVLREVRPFFSSGDAMWCLLICDMNLSLACAMDGDALPGLASDETAFLLSLPQMKPEPSMNSIATSRQFDLNGGNPHKSSVFSLYSQTGLQNDLPPVAGIPSLPPVKLLSVDNSSVVSTNAAAINPNLTRENMPSLVDCVIQGFSSTGTLETLPPAEKLVNGKRCTGVGIYKRDSILRHKSMHLEKGCRAYRSRGSLRSGKLSNLGSLVDRKSRTSFDPAGLNLKNSMLKKSKPLGLDTLQGGETPNLSFSVGSCATLPLTLKTDSILSQVPGASTELTLSLPSKATNTISNDASVAMTSGNSDISNYWNYNGFTSEKLCRQWTIQERKDDILNKLVPRVRELHTQVQGWSEWAQQKVMQAARRLSKDKAELHSLRQEKEEVSRLMKEKQTLEENTSKKLSEMDSALSKASCQIEKANSSIRRLEVENANLRQQLESAKLRAAKSAENCRENSGREMTSRKTFQFWDRQIAQFHDELMVDKNKLSQLQQQYDQDKIYLDQLEAKFKQEKKMNDDALMLVHSERKEREQMEISAKSKEDTIRLKAENDFLLYKDEMRKLENQIAQLRLKTDTSRILALRQGVNNSYASRLANGLGSPPKDSGVPCYSQILDVHGSGYDEVQRERECVMCLTEEMSVVFLPCAHQVVCGTCNKIHEQQGMKDCPSCRTPIKQRITVRKSCS